MSSLTTPPTCSTTATSASPVGFYAIACSGAVDSNYEIGYVDGSMQVTAAALVITASSGSMTYGGSVPVITANYSGFVNDDSASFTRHAAHLFDDGRRRRVRSAPTRARAQGQRTATTRSPTSSVKSA